MTETELTEKLEAIRAQMGWADDLVHLDLVEGEFKHYITDEQVKFVRQIFDLFRSLNWQIHLNKYRTLTVRPDSPVNKDGCGTPVKLRSCKPEHGDKTYFGILLGDIPLEIHHQIDAAGNLTASRSMYNPAIFVPELGDIVFGAESFWGAIESASELDRLITDETIQNLWYIKMLKAMSPATEGEGPAKDIAEEDLVHLCATCGGPLEAVRPGKYQCPNCEGETNL